METSSDKDIPEYNIEWRNGRSDEIYKHEAKAVELALSLGFMPLAQYNGVGADWPIECLACKTQFVTSYLKLQSAKNICSNCFKTRKSIAANDPSSEVFKILETRKLLPLEEYSGDSSKKWKCKCLNCEKVVYIRFTEVKKGKGGCTDCSVKWHLREERITQITKVMLEAHLQPLSPYKSSSKPWECLCLRCGEKVTPTYQNVKRGHGGCIYCQEHSFKHTKPAYFYIIEHLELGALKVGVGNLKSTPDRIKTHLKDGWQLFYRIDFDLGKDAYALETHILRWFRKDLKLPPFLEQGQMKKAGRTETISAEAITVLQIKQKVEALLTELNLPFIK
jgi:hypothetical protein